MFLIFAMVLAAAGMKAYENTKARSKARWDEARRRAEERSAERDRERQARAKAWEKRFDTAISTGPRSALWWPYAAGWVIGGGIAAVGAGAVGAVSGAIAGGRSGYALGQIAGENGRKAGETFQQWRKANRGKPDPVELGICGRCKGWIRKDRLQYSAEYKQVCPDCTPSTTQDPPPWVQKHNDEFERGALNDEPIAIVHERMPGDDGRCCKGCGGLLLGDESLCLECSTRIAWMAERAKAQRPPIRCDRCGTPVSTRSRCGTCREKAAAADRREQEQAEKAAKAEQDAKADGPIRVTAERIYPEPEEQSESKGIENIMNALPAGTAAGIDTTGEGYDSTIVGLTELAAAIAAAKEAVDGFNESLAAHGLDADTLNTLSTMQDSIESLNSDAEGLVRHVEERHNPMATATAAAGGSHNVATKTWYDGH